MKHRLSLIFVLVSMIAGCSRHGPDAKTPEATADAKAPKVTDLGVVDVSGGKPVRQDLGDGRVCVITPTVITKDSAKFIRMKMVFEQTDSSGVAHKQSAPIIICNPGDTAEWRVGDIHIRLKTEVKP